MSERCIDCGREQQEFHPEFPIYRDWFYGFQGKQRCGDCEITYREANDIDLGKSLPQLNEELRLEEKGE